jgi:hypothetical protein
MRLWLVVDRDRWGHSTNLVEAETREEARRVVMGDRSGISWVGVDRVDVEEIPLKGEPGIRWCEDESPDTPRED